MKATILTYAGRRQTTDGKLAHEYRLEDGSAILFSKALLPATVGAALKAEVVSEDETGVRSVGKAEYTGNRLEGDEVATWAALDRAAVGADEARKQARNVDPFKAQLAPMKRAMWNMTAPQRAAFITAVVRELQRDN